MRYPLNRYSIAKLDNYYVPSDLEQAVANFVSYYNTQRCGSETEQSCTNYGEIYVVSDSARTFTWSLGRGGKG